MPVGGLSVTVEVTVTSTYQITSVVASVASASAALVPDSIGWGGSVPLQSVARGAQTLPVTATDVLGGVSTATTAIDVDHPPTLTVVSPAVLDNAVALPTLHLDVDCSDGDGTCVSIAASCYGGATPLVTSAPPLVADVDLTGCTSGLLLVATDAATSRRRSPQASSSTTRRGCRCWCNRRGACSTSTTRGSSGARRDPWGVALVW